MVDGAQHPLGGGLAAEVSRRFRWSSPFLWASFEGTMSFRFPRSCSSIPHPVVFYKYITPRKLYKRSCKCIYEPATSLIASCIAGIAWAMDKTPPSFWGLVWKFAVSLICRILNRYNYLCWVGGRDDHHNVLRKLAARAFLHCLDLNSSKTRPRSEDKGLFKGCFSFFLFPFFVFCFWLSRFACRVGEGVWGA